MFASVLHLRGSQVTRQPHVDNATGDIFCWNGEVGLVLLSSTTLIILQVFEGMEVGHNSSQRTEVLTSAHIDYS